jgi:hypothetical protein
MMLFTSEARELGNVLKFSDAMPKNKKESVNG